MSGWIKLHRAILENELLQNDLKAYIVFTKLLLHVDRKTGARTGGRYQLESLTGLKGSTIYKVLKRLEKAGMIEQKSNNHSTTIRICNWSNYQGDGKNQVKAEQKPSKSPVTLYKKKEVRSKKDTSRIASNTDLSEVFDYFIKKTNKNANQYKLSKTRRSKLKVRLNDAGKDMLMRAIDNLADSDWHNGDNDRGWSWDLDYLIRSYENVEKHAGSGSNSKEISFKADW